MSVDARKMILENKGTFNVCPSQCTFEIELKRRQVSYEDLSARFVCLKKDFKKQFAHIYSARLMLVKDRIIQACFSKWGLDIPVRKLSELSDESKEKCIVIGTLFKHQELKPSILKELSEENQVMPQPARSHYVSDDDQLILEDEIQRIRLVGKFDLDEYVTGVVIGLLGFENEEGKFEVEDMCFAGPSKNLERPLTVQDENFLVLVSGLKIGCPESALALELLVDSIKGDLGSILDQEKWAKVCRVLIAGNSITASPSVSSTSILNFEIEEGSNTLTIVKQLDSILEDLAKSIEIDLMPGEFDPSNHILPQQAIYDCVFPKASSLNSFHCTTNPYECNLGGRRILGTSGQPINNIKSLSKIEKPLDILEKTLIWGHLAPTAPDTLACYPYYNEDPFIITEQPDVYFAGNQPEFETKVVHLNGHQTRLICIPPFYKTQTCILLNLKNLETIPITFTT